MPATRWLGSTSIPAPHSSPTCRTRSTKSSTSPAAPIPNGAPSAPKTAIPHPFPLHYIEVGNEDQFDHSRSYDGRFAQFYHAIKQRYPDLQIIATTPVKGVTPDVLDEHFYMSAQESFSEAHHYDAADRNGPKIFVGEWATREGDPTPNLEAALADAAWLTGLERNSDLIIMTSYAPLFVNVNPGGMQWAPDLIGYDALTSYGSPSYWTQVMFSTHLGTEIVPAALANAPPRVFASVTRDDATHKLFVKVVNATSTAQLIAIDLAGVSKVAPQATLTTMSGKTPNATNSITHPEAVVPVIQKPSRSRVRSSPRLSRPTQSTCWS